MLCLTPGWYRGGLLSFASWKRVLPGPLWEQAEGREQEECHSSAISPLPEPRSRLAPAALAEEEDKACASLQHPHLIPPSLPPMAVGTESACASNPYVPGGSFFWQEWPAPGPSPSLRGAGSSHLPQTQPFGPIQKHAWVSTIIAPPHPHFPLLHPTCSHMNAASLKERSLPEAALFVAFSERLSSSHCLRAEGCVPSHSV